jgi:hypothetical protein
MKFASIFALAVLAAVPVLAQNDISWVSQRTGVDNGACGPIASPCRTFEGATLITNTGGTITP